MNADREPWQKRGRIFMPPAGDPLRRSHAQLPVVDSAHPDRWRIYYSSRDGEGRSLPYCLDVEPGRPEHVLADHATPLLAHGAPGCFDEHGVMPTAIADIDGRKHLYYIGWSRGLGVPYRNAIGLAISDDGGRTYVKYSDGPIIGQGPVDPLFTGTFTLLRVGDAWFGWYLSCTEWRDVGDRLEPRYLIRQAFSDDGITWRREGGVAIDYQSDDEGGIAGATVIPRPGGYAMWYASRKDRDFRTHRANSYRIGYAESEDAMTWTRLDDQAGIDVSEEGWDSEMICYPCVVAWEDRWYMFYNGNGFGRSGIGYATRRRPRGDA